MQQNIEDDEVLELQLLYYIHSEIISSEEINKILWNQQIQQWEQLISQDYFVSIIGLYGIQQTICEYLEKRLCNRVRLSDDALMHQKQSMICFMNHKNTYYLAFIGLEHGFMKDYFIENIELTLFRYLKDLCSYIILLPSRKILDDIQNDSIIFQETELRIDQEYIQMASKFLEGQGNIRAYYCKKKQNFDLIDEKILQKIFRQLWQGNQLSQLDFIRDFPINIQEILQQSAYDVQEQINQKKQKKYKKCEEALKLQRDYLLREFKIQDILLLVFQLIWDNMPVHKKLKYNEELKNILFQSIENKYPDQYDSFKKNPRFIDALELIISQSVLILLHFYKQKKRKNSMTIKDIYDKFIFQVSQSILKQNNQQLDIEIQLFQFTSIISSDKGQKKLFGIIEQISTQQLDIKYYFQLQNTEDIYLVYYFRTQRSKQNMFVFEQSDKNKKFQYKWVYAQGDKTYKTIFTYKQQGKQLLFYYDTVNSKLYAFNCNNGICCLSFDEQKNVLIRDDSETCDKHISDCSYLQYFGCFMLLSNEKLYKWQSKKFELINFSQQEHQMDLYQKLFSVGSGYYYCLANLQYFNIFDFTHQIIKSIKFEDYLITISNMQQITLFADQTDWFLCLINYQRQITIQINNINTQSQIINESIDEVKIKYSNPFLDIIKDSEDKFGLPQLLISTSQQISELVVTNDIYEIILEYFDYLNLRITNKLIENNNNYQIEGFKVKINDLVFIMISRVSLQLCTIDQSVLVPLQTGLYKRNFISVDQQNKIDILDKIERLKFGIFEMVQYFSQFKIFVVSIMGKQSCGKSYFMNRLFGTRFGVSSARCTDGIQMSVSKIENIIFITLDCEGLFSQRRTAEEEKMLLIFLTGLSDVTILNQDLTFNRTMDEVFSNLASFSDNIKGDNLFKGKLMIAVRDVNQKERDSAEKELFNNINNIRNSQQNANFLSLLFNGDFITIFLSHFENKSFETQVQEIRRSLIKQSQNKQGKWIDYQCLLQTIKIMLVQLEVNDHRKIDDIIKENNIRKLKNQAISLWQQYQIGDIYGINFTNLDLTFLVLQEFYLSQMNANQVIHQKINHNKILKQIEQEIKQFLNQRAMFQ